MSKLAFSVDSRHNIFVYITKRQWCGASLVLKVEE
jgi:hypothetical protein